MNRGHVCRTPGTAMYQICSPIRALERVPSPFYESFLSPNGHDNPRRYYDLNEQPGHSPTSTSPSFVFAHLLIHLQLSGRICLLRLLVSYIPQRPTFSLSFLGFDLKANSRFLGQKSHIAAPNSLCTLARPPACRSHHRRWRRGFHPRP